MSSELQGWPIERFDLPPNEGDFRPERKIIVPWATRFNEAAALDEQEYPYIPGCGAYPEFIQIDPFDAQNNVSGPLASYGNALITVRYTTKLNTSAAIIEFITPAHYTVGSSSKGVNASDGSPIQPSEQASRAVSGCIFHHTRAKVAVVPAGAITAVDCVNSSTVYSTVLGISFAAETLRVLVPTISRVWTTSGLTSYTVAQQFAYFSGGGLGWNTRYDSATGAFTYTYNDNNQRLRQYPLASIVLV